MKEYMKLASLGIFTALIFFGAIVAFRLYDIYTSRLYKIRTNDGVYYSKSFKHFGSTVEFKDLDSGEEMKKSQDKLSGVVIERIN